MLLDLNISRTLIIIDIIEMNYYSYVMFVIYLYNTSGSFKLTMYLVQKYIMPAWLHVCSEKLIH